ncbi:MAG: glycosyltransferase [Bacteroidota bacterium]
MTIIFSITALIILVYLLYPLWLILITPGSPPGGPEPGEINCVTLILLTYNGRPYLQQKISFLMIELSYFESYELLIIDDRSLDGSAELLNTFTGNEHVKIINNYRHEGIPYSMNLGISHAKYEHVIFCDQRQELSEGILKRLVEPLRYARIGAVSGCISYLDRQKKYSILRRHENMLKQRESRAGSLIGVYGPLYAIKKNCYCTIPGDIILDDLYLSLCILRSKEIVIREDCKIIDEDFTTLYNYKRARRYFTGFIQLLNEKSVLRGLKGRQRVMLFWHKYLRLLIPFFVLSCYIEAGAMTLQGVKYQILFFALTLTGLVSVIPMKSTNFFRKKNLVRLNILYFLAIIDVIFSRVLFQKTLRKRPTGT